MTKIDFLSGMKDETGHYPFPSSLELSTVIESRYMKYTVFLTALFSMISQEGAGDKFQCQLILQLLID